MEEMYMSKFSIEIDIIKKDLLSAISKRFSISYNDLLEELSKIKHIKTETSKYSCDHYFFSKDNERSFYWAGFIAADGCVYKKGNIKRLVLSLAKKDLNHLLQFKNDIEFNGIISTSVSKHSLTNPKWNDSIKETIAISSLQLFEDLKRFNVVPNKTKSYTLPKWLHNHELVHHFMRGYVDGDGSFSYDKVRNRICFELRGTKEFLLDYQMILENKLAIKSKVNVTTPDSTSKIKYSGKKIVPEIVKILYKDATVFLPRKYDIAKRSLDILNGTYLIGVT